MALRLEHDGVKVDEVNENLAEALKQFIASSGNAPMRIFCTYTAMLALREELAKITDVERVSLMTATHALRATPPPAPITGRLCVFCSCTRST